MTAKVFEEKAKNLFSSDINKRKWMTILNTMSCSIKNLVNRIAQKIARQTPKISSWLSGWIWRRMEIFGWFRIRIRIN
jgi:hypothetical protein